MKDTGLMTPNRFNIYVKPLSWNTQRKNKLELNEEIIARTKDIDQDVWNFFICSGRSFMAKTTFLQGNINLQNTPNLSLSNHIPEMSYSIRDTYILYRLVERAIQNICIFTEYICIMYYVFVLLYSVLCIICYVFMQNIFVFSILRKGFNPNFPSFRFLSVLSSDVLILYKRELFLFHAFLWKCFTTLQL